MTGKCDNIQPMASWLDEPENEGDCKPCRIAAIIGDYQEILERSGCQDLADELTDKIEAEGPDPIGELVKAMDEIKLRVSDPVKKELLKIDCMVQTEPI